MGIGIGRPGIEDRLTELGLPVVPRGERFAQVRDTVAALRQLDGPDLHTGGDGGARTEVEHLLPRWRTRLPSSRRRMTLACRSPSSPIASARSQDVELALHVPVVGGAVAPFMTAPDTDPVALRAIDLTGHPPR